MPMKFTWQQFRRADVPKKLGRVVTVDFPQFGMKDVEAKVDTGAFSGALHATNIKEVGGKLQFQPLGSESHVLEFAKYNKRLVKSSNGNQEERYIVGTDIIINGQIYPITITLTDRSDMKFQVLIGRRFLRKHEFLVDVSIDNK